MKVFSQKNFPVNRLRKVTLNESGFTLIELLVAAALLVFGLMAFGYFNGNLVTQNSKLERETQAATLAQDKIEELKNLALQNTLDNTDGGNDTVGMFTRTWVVDNTDTSLLDVTVTVSWTGTGTSNVSLRTLISQ